MFSKLNANMRCYSTHHSMGNECIAKTFSRTLIKMIRVLGEDKGDV